MTDTTSQSDHDSAGTEDLPTLPTDDVLRVDGRYYVRVASGPADENDGVLKQGETFAIFDRFGDIKPVGLGEEGLYHNGTRYLSGLRLHLGDERPLLLGSTARRDNSRLAIDLTNPDMKIGDRELRSGAIHISRSKVLWNASFHERIEIRNFGLQAWKVPMTLLFVADYVDIFEVRGIDRERRGELRAPRVRDGTVTTGYEGLDGTRRRTRLRFDPKPLGLDGSAAMWELDLPPGRSMTIDLQVSCESERPVPSMAFGVAESRAGSELERRFDRSVRFSSSSEMFDDWIHRSLADVVMMTSDTPHGAYPYAGIPWFSTVFGRDGIITALQLAWAQPFLARGVLAHLAATQATETDPQRDAQPGKILHEARDGEMAKLGEVPFERYYGSHDATPLFVVLAETYYRHTGDLPFIRDLWPHIEAALAWMDGPADPDGDGFLEYERRSPTGLTHQGWKDSDDSVFHADGELATGPIALCEIQAYAYAARLAAASLATALDRTRQAERLTARAEELRAAFEDSFWIDELGTYGIALDGNKKLCRVRTSNPGHCLFAGIVGPDRAARVAEELLSDAMFSGWGIRTVAAGQPRYNPMSYHDGSVWPHDNAIAALGLARSGFPNHAARVMGALFDVSRHFNLARLPELFCGFTRRPGEGPTHYPVACSPQAWASGSVFMLLQACLGLEVDAINHSVTLSNARLPKFLDHLRIENLSIGDARVDLNVERQRSGVGVELLHRSGTVSIVNVK